MKLHYISVTSKLVKKFITNLDLSKALFGLDCIPVVVLKNCELEFSYILPELFNMCLKQYCFLDCWLVPVFKNVEEMCTVKNYHLVGLLSLDSRVCERLLNNRLVDHLEKCDFFYFQYGFRSSQSTLDLLTVVSDRIARAFNKLLIELQHLIYLILSTGSGLLVLFTNLNLMEFQVRYLAFFLFFVSIRHLRMVLLGREEFLSAPFLIILFSYYTLMTFLMIVSIILLSMLMILLFTLGAIRHLICDNN